MRPDAAREHSIVLGVTALRLIYLVVSIAADLLIPDYDTSAHLDTDQLAGLDWLVQRVIQMDHTSGSLYTCRLCVALRTGTLCTSYASPRYSPRKRCTSPSAVGWLRVRADARLLSLSSFAHETRGIDRFVLLAFAPFNGIVLWPLSAFLSRRSLLLIAGVCISNISFVFAARQLYR